VRHQHRRGPCHALARSFDARLQALDKHLPAWSDRLVQSRVDHDWKMDRQSHAPRHAAGTGILRAFSALPLQRTAMPMASR
jgi:hypothetical protein